jgi:hypothetical protein
MKRLILISALLFSFNSWADDEFPIEITCSIDGGGIIQFHLTKELFEIKSKRLKLDPNSWLRIPKESAPEMNIYLFNQGWRGNIKPTKMIEKAKPYIDKKLYIIGDFQYRLIINDTIIMVNFRSPLHTGMFPAPNFVSTATIIRNTGKIGIYSPTMTGPNEVYGNCKKGLDLPVPQLIEEKNNLF